MVSDCIAIQQVHTTHFFANSLNEAAAMCLEAGTDWDLCGGYLEHLREAVSTPTARHSHLLPTDSNPNLLILILVPADTSRHEAWPEASLAEVNQS